MMISLSAVVTWPAGQGRGQGQRRAVGGVGLRAVRACRQAGTARVACKPMHLSPPPLTRAEDIFSLGDS